MQIDKLGYLGKSYFSAWDKNTCTSVRVYAEGIKTDDTRVEEDVYWFTVIEICYEGRAVYFSKVLKE
jgi:hypothetical protein